MIVPQPHIRWTSRDPDHDATYASAAKLRGGRPNLHERLSSQGQVRVTATSDRYRQFNQLICRNSCPFMVLLMNGLSRSAPQQLKIVRRLAGSDHAP
jgi:hypothetical protein